MTMFAFRNRSGARRASAARRHARIWLQSLESRLNPAQLVVTSAADSGPGSLRAIIATANTNGEADTITFNPSITTIYLTTGQLTISESQDLLIDGGGTVTINGAPTASLTNRLLNITATGQPTIRLQGITLSKGNVTGSGGAILLTGQKLQLSNATITMNSAGYSGGGIFASGATVTIDDSTILANTASSETGTLASSAKGGGIYAVGGSLTLVKCSVTKNDIASVNWSDGAGIFLSGTMATVESSTIADNRISAATWADGAGLYSAYGTTVTLSNSTIADNRILAATWAYGCGLYSAYGTTVTLSSSTIADNRILAATWAYGCGIYVSTGSLSMLNCTVDNNQSTSNTWAAGVGIYSTGTAVTLNNTSVSSNEIETAASAEGGGIWTSAGSLLLMGCAVTENKIASPGTGHSYGAGTYSEGTTVTLDNSTIAGNEIEAATWAYGGGVYSTSNTIAIYNCTIANNVALTTANWSYAGGIYLDPTVTSAVIESSIVATNSAKNSVDIEHSNVNLSGSHNLFSVDPAFWPLASYDGKPPVLALRAYSPAIDKGSNVLNLTTDQLGTPRELPTGFPDIGAFEFDASIPQVVGVGGLSDITTSNNIPLVVSVTYDAPTGIKSSSIDAWDISVVGPQPVGSPTVQGVFVQGTTVTATYQFNVPGGSWDVRDAGVYSIYLNSKQVFDKSSPSRAVGGHFLGSFRVLIAGTMVVDSTADVSDGNFDHGQFSLREAINVANAAPLANDTITFDPSVFAAPAIIALAGELEVTGSMTITGPGASLLTISGGHAHRLFNLGGYVPNLAVNLSGMTLANGSVSGSGGAVLDANHPLAIADCILTNDSASNQGGAIVAPYLSSAQFTLTGSRITGNVASNGGALYLPVYTIATISKCIIANNSATQQGGGIYSASNHGSSISKSTIEGNVSAVGGGIYDYRSFVVENSTVVANSATTNGGGIVLRDSFSSVTIRSSTISANSAANSGGGIFLSTGSMSPAITSSIVAGNLATNGPDFSFFAASTISGNNNLIGVANAGNVTFTGSNNLTGTIAAPLNPMLGPLANYGGPTLTMALLQGSPCINAGTVITGITTDQRGYLRKYGSAPDIGAFELQPPRVASVVINDGSAQRSRVTSVTVNFDSTVVIGPGAFQLQRQSDGKLVDVFPDFQIGGPTTSVSLSFSGPLTEYGSLQDGRYTLTVFGNHVSDFVGGLDGKGNGTAGSDYVFASRGATGIFRLFGDSNGDGSVSANDLIAFRQYFGGYLFAFDFDGDGSVSASDFMQFRLRFGGSI
jgi:hypothetical protein